MLGLSDKKLCYNSVECDCVFRRRVSQLELPGAEGAPGTRLLCATLSTGRRRRDGRLAAMA